MVPHPGAPLVARMASFIACVVYGQGIKLLVCRIVGIPVCIWHLLPLLSLCFFLSRLGYQKGALHQRRFWHPRACLKIHSRHLHPLICGIFLPNSVNVARYASFIWQKSPTNCRIHLSESNFQTRSSDSNDKVECHGYY